MHENLQIVTYLSKSKRNLCNRNAVKQMTYTTSVIKCYFINSMKLQIVFVSSYES